MMEGGGGGGLNAVKKMPEREVGTDGRDFKIRSEGYY
jgi:hypothetical protein